MIESDRGFSFAMYWSKADIKNIINLIEKYNGCYIINSDNNEFYFSIIM